MNRKPLKRLGIFGVAGHNRGDDAICRCLIDGFLTALPGLEIEVAIRRPCSISEQPGVKPFVLDRRSIGGILNLISVVRRVDAVVMGGGSVVQDQFGDGRLKGILGYVWTVSWLAKLLGKPVISAPIGIDQIRTPKGRRAAREFLNRLDWITVRDELSRSMAIAIAGEAISEKISVVCDPVFAFETGRPLEASVEAEYVLSPAFEEYNEERIADIFREIILLLLEEEPHARIVLIAMDERQREDHGKIGRLIENLPPSISARVRRATPSSPEEAAILLRGARGVIAMRLHALIMAYGFAPVYCVSRTTKTQALMQAYDVDGISMVDIVDARQTAVAAVGSIKQGGNIKEQSGLREEMAKSMSLYFEDSVDRMMILHGNTARQES